MTKTLPIGQILRPLLRPAHAEQTGSRTPGAGRVARRHLLIAIDAHATTEQASVEFVTAAAVFSTCSVSGLSVGFERGRCNRKRRRQVHHFQ
jgi:hypothetical protein